MARGPRLLACGVGLLGLAAPLHAQLNVGASAGAIRYEQAPGATSLELNPELTLTGTRALLDATGDATTASDGSGALAGGATLWGATRPVLDHLQLDGWLQGSYTKPAGDSASGSLLAFGEGAWAGDGYGAGVGAGVLRGMVAGLPAVNAVRGSVRGWATAGPVSLALSVQPTALSTRVWFTDVTGNAEWDPGSAEISGTVQVRQSPATGLDVGGEASVTYHLTGRVALAASAGRYLRDPFQALPQGVHANVGVVLTVWNPRAVDERGVSKGELTDVDLSALGLNLHSFRGSGIRMNPATSKGMSAGGTGRGHRL